MRQTPSVFCRVDFAMMARRRFWQGSEEFEAHPQMTLGLDMSRALHRALASLQPIIDRLLDAARLGKVVCDQLGLDRWEDFASSTSAMRA
jgi:hypothetical protein